MITTENWISSSQTTYCSTLTTCLNSARADYVNIRVSQCSAVPEDCLESAIPFTTTTGMAHSPTSRRKPEYRIRMDTTVWASSVATLTKMVGSIFLWLTTRRRTSYTTTTVTARSKRSGSRPA